MTRRRKRSSPFRIGVLILLVGAFIYVNQVIVPATPPPFLPTPTPTRSPESYLTDAENLLNEGKFALAIQAYEEAIQANPTNPSVYITLARLNIYNGKYEAAATNAENALLLNSNNSMAHALRGWALGFMGDYLQAESAIKQAIDQDPANAAAYAFRAEILVLQDQSSAVATLGSLDNAIEASRKAIELDPNLLESHRARGVVLEATGNYIEAAREFEIAISMNDNISDLHLALGRNYRFLQQYDQAVEQFNRANALNPTDPLPDTYISRTYATIGEYATAILFAQQAVKDDPNDPYLWGNLGQMLYKNIQYPEANAALKLAVRGGTTPDGEAVDGLPLDYGRVAEYYYTYGLGLARMGECNEALQISQLVQTGVPNDETAMYNAQEMNNICSEFAGSRSKATPTIEGDQAEDEIQATAEVEN